MTALHKNLKLYLEKISDGSISKQQLTEFIHYSRVIVQSYLFQIRTSLTFLYSQQGLSAEDVAWDCLGSLFIKDSTFRYPIFVRFKTSLSTSLETISEVELFSAYKGLLITFADRQLARLFAQFDVDGAKIHRNIRDCIKTTSLFTLSKDIRGLVLKPFAHNSLDHLPAF
ncbi:MAG: hypothetical protein HYZ34_09545, partial [Ignavibacteriae bacterium]|nr:hypothetical protein [Ignavibacteriota bacterium]